MQRRSSNLAIPFNAARPSLQSRCLSLAGRRGAAMMGAIALAGFASPALAQDEPQTRLVRCGEQTCLEVSGYREHSSVLICVNGNEVPAEGEKSWKIQLPLETVRQWSATHARTIEVSLRDPDSQQSSSASADLPIGLLGAVTSLAFLQISAR